MLRSSAMISHSAGVSLSRTSSPFRRAESSERSAALAPSLAVRTTATWIERRRSRKASWLKCHQSRHETRPAEGSPPVVAGPDPDGPPLSGPGMLGAPVLGPPGVLGIGTPQPTGV